MSAPPFTPPQLAAILADSNMSQTVASSSSRPLYLGTSQFASGFFPTPTPYVSAPLVPLSVQYGHVVR